MEFFQTKHKAIKSEERTVFKMIPIHDKIAQSYRVVREMIRDRNVLSEDELAYLFSKDYHEIVDLSKNADTTIEIDVPNALKIMYYRHKKINTAKLQQSIQENVKLVLAIFTEKLSTANMKSLAELGERLKAQGTDLHIFQLSELMFNITKHDLVPKHEVITDKKEIENIMQKYSLKSLNQLPLILHTDPVARYYGMKHGQVAKITRPSPSAGEYVLYRCCV
jgi:DNA-directed RNA polymerase I, II, and III subunit RPABC1